MDDFLEYISTNETNLFQKFVTSPIEMFQSLLPIVQSINTAWGYRQESEGDHIGFEYDMHYANGGNIRRYQIFTDPLFRVLAQLLDQLPTTIRETDTTSKTEDAYQELNIILKHEEDIIKLEQLSKFINKFKRQCNSLQVLADTRIDMQSHVVLVWFIVMSRILCALGDKRWIHARALLQAITIINTTQPAKKGNFQSNQTMSNRKHSDEITVKNKIGASDHASEKDNNSKERRKSHRPVKVQRKSAQRKSARLVRARDAERTNMHAMSVFGFSTE